MNLAVNELYSAATAATAYRSKSDLARDLGTRTGLLFPRPAGPATIVEPAGTNRATDVPAGTSAPTAAPRDSIDAPTVRRSVQ